ncbi:Hsp20/alpha crystallin family protein [Puniceibacterium sediminis]|uniref:Heat shock protein Hsp20 n=1 Tax=Puniceibacterium sediminis TaxID=1608407 RepID=A0A238ZNK5_9RHOB|nr:Hsp20/alpha crystallin family protein [Puniceibacterium sediminis]SNR84985.1 heat shock protein Hsp20 [Puniceibacterium sediminis]
MPKKTNTPQTSGDTVGWPLIQSFQTEVNRMFDRFNATPFGADRKVMPVLDIAETADAIEITAEIPGVKPEDLDVSISDETLILKGQKSDAREDRSKDWYHVERSFGSFRRHVPLGFAPKDGKVDAKFKDGILTLRIDKPADVTEKTRKIEVTGA